MKIRPLGDRAIVSVHCHDDLGLAVALMALRKAENGAPGREYGVLSMPAPTYADQLRIAANSLRHREREYRDRGERARQGGFFTEGFLRAFSARWAPLHVENDPKGLNSAHAANLVALAQKYADTALAAWSTVA